MKIICLSGWLRSGKDMCAAHLRETHGFKRLAFADALKELAADQYGVPLEWFHEDSRKDAPLAKFPALAKDTFSTYVLDSIKAHLKPILGLPGLYHTPRTLAILEGSVKRTVDPDYWVRLAVSNADPNDVFVISDLRYRSEIDGLKAVAGEDNVITMRILRFENTTSTDPSERDLDDYEFDYRIDNSEARQMPKELVFKQVDEALTKAGILIADTGEEN